MIDVDSLAEQVASLLRPQISAACEANERIAQLLSPLAKSSSDRIASRQTAISHIAAYYQPKIVAGYRKLFPGVVKAARNAAGAHRNLGATKAATTDDQAAMVAQTVTRFRQSLQANTAPLAAVLAALHTDAWVAGIQAAANGPGGDSINANLGPVSVDEPEDWEPGWGESADISSPPAGLAQMLDDADATAQRLAGGLLDRISAALEDGLLAATAVSLKPPALPRRQARPHTKRPGSHNSR
jgi:hypothetical protein